MASNVRAAARSEIGLIRQRNEDAVYAGSALFAVADGLGGHVAGDIASSTVIETLRTHDRTIESSDLSSILGRAVFEANRALHLKIEDAPELTGMGTTLVALFCVGSNAVLANVGDSRGYLLQNNTKLTQITEDHTYRNLVSNAATIPKLPERITRFLDGRVDGRSPDLSTHKLNPGDRFLLCSDGLSGPVPLGQIREALRVTTDPDGAADLLISLAISHGGPDNITVIVIDVH